LPRHRNAAAQGAIKINDPNVRRRAMLQPVSRQIEAHLPGLRPRAEAAARAAMAPIQSSTA